MKVQTGSLPVSGAKYFMKGNYKMELNEHGKEIQRIMNDLGDIVCKTWYGKTVKEVVNEIFEEALRKYSVD